MAKKDPSELSVEERLKTLYQLQTALSAIDEKRALRGELPLEVQDLEDEIEGLTTRVDNKNNREYDTLSKEIEFQTLEIELCNKKIREANNKIADKEQEKANSEALIAERQGDLDVKKNELEEIMEETRVEEEKLKEQVKNLEAKIEGRLLTSFKRIRKNARNGLGIVYVQRDACGGCFNKIPPQRQLDIKMHKKIIVCEYCGRIMIDPELAGVKVEKPATGEEKKKGAKRAIRKSSGTSTSSASSKKAADANDMA